MAKHISGIYHIDDDGVFTRFYLTTPDDIYRARSAVYGLQNWYSLKNNKKREDFIWDEDKTVRENRRMTAEHNSQVDQEIAKRQDIFKRSSDNLEAAIIEYIQEYFEYEDVKCSKEHAQKIWNFCKQQWEDDPHNYISDICRFYMDIMS